MRWQFWAAALCYCVLLVWLSTRPIDLPEFTDFEHRDKVTHALAYGGLAAVLAVGGRRGNKAWARQWALWYPLAFVFAFGSGVELVQLMLAYRKAEGLDIVANMVGALLAVWLVARYVPPAAPNPRPA